MKQPSGAPKPVDVDQAKRDPTAVFDHPRDVLSSNIPLAEKKEILDQWRYDAAEMAVAVEEGMGGGESALLDEVISAQRQLTGEDPAAEESGQGAKQGLT